MNETRSTADETKGLRYFARTLDKIRLHAKGELDLEYHENSARVAIGGCSNSCESNTMISAPAFSEAEPMKKFLSGVLKMADA